MKNPIKVGLLLATFNPNLNFLSQLVASIETPENFDVTVYWGDDGSSDEIFPEIRSLLLSRFKVVEHHSLSVGPKMNFMLLLSHSLDSDFIFFVDQDDIWHKDRMALQIYHLKSSGRKGPVVSYFFPRTKRGSQISHPKKHKITKRSILVENRIQGCTILMNQKAALSMLKSPFEVAVMHDWWIIAIAIYIGVLLEYPDPLLDYRLHDGNSIGMPGLLQRFKRLFNSGGTILQRQNRGLRHFLGAQGIEASTLDKWNKLYDQGGIQRILAIMLDDVRRTNVIDEIGRRLFHAIRVP